MYGYSRPEIVYVKTLDQLNEKFDYNTYGTYYVKTVFGKYQVIDITHDNKLVTVKASPRTAQERVEKQLAYKKHKDCEIVVKEVDLTADLELSLFNVFGTEASYKWVSMIEDKRRAGFSEKDPYRCGPEFYPEIKDLIFIDRGINMKFKISEIEVDKNIITQSEKQMRLTVLSVEDLYGNHEKITLFDNDIVDSFKEGQDNFIKVTNAEVNMRRYEGRDDPVPEGLKIPSWAKIEMITKDDFPNVDPSIDMYTYEKRHEQN